MRKRRLGWTLGVVAGALVLVGAPPLSAAPILQGIGALPGHSSSLARGVSPDGTFVVGGSQNQAVIWSEAGGLVGLGMVPGVGSTSSSAVDISADGSVAAGVNFETAGWEAMRWTQAGGMVGLGDLGGGDFQSEARALSADGSVVVGYGTTDVGREAFRWTNAGGMVPLGDLAGGTVWSEAYAVSADGSVVVGVSMSAFGWEPFIWTQAGGMVGLGDLPGGLNQGTGRGVSADGSVVVGSGGTAAGREALRWTEAEGLVSLGDLPGGIVASTANGVSNDGSVVVGMDNSSPSEFQAFIWTEADGIQRLFDVLVSQYGLDLAGWDLQVANAVSDDGKVIVGQARNPSGRLEGFVVSLRSDDPVPEPATLALFALGGLGLLARRARVRPRRGRQRNDAA